MTEAIHEMLARQLRQKTAIPRHQRRKHAGVLINGSDPTIGIEIGNSTRSFDARDEGLPCADENRIG